MDRGKSGLRWRGKVHAIAGEARDQLPFDDGESKRDDFHYTSNSIFSDVDGDSGKTGGIMADGEYYEREYMQQAFSENDLRERKRGKFGPKMARFPFGKISKFGEWKLEKQFHTKQALQYILSFLLPLSTFLIYNLLPVQVLIF